MSPEPVPPGPGSGGEGSPEPGSRAAPAARVVLTGDGPVLVEGPVEVELPDGRRVRSERPVVALCTCGRTRRQPFCDTSHRTRVRDRGRGPEGRS